MGQEGVRGRPRQAGAVQRRRGREEGREVKEVGVEEDSKEEGRMKGKRKEEGSREGMEEEQWEGNMEGGGRLEAGGRRGKGCSRSLLPALLVGATGEQRRWLGWMVSGQLLPMPRRRQNCSALGAGGATRGSWAEEEKAGRRRGRKASAMTGRQRRPAQSQPCGRRQSGGQKMKPQLQARATERCEWPPSGKREGLGSVAQGVRTEVWRRLHRPCPAGADPRMQWQAG